MHVRKNHIDPGILIAVLILMVTSLGVVYSASSTYALERFGGSERLLGSHALKVLMGFVMIFVFMRIPYQKLEKLTKPVLLGAVVVLAVTLALGGEMKGASRWLRLGGFGFQPSEFAKYALIFHIAALLSRKDVRQLSTGFVPVIVWIGAVTFLVLRQPNFSTGVLIGVVSMVMLFVGRAKPAHIAGTVAAAIPLLVFYMLSAPYRKARIMSFLTGTGEAGNAGSYQRWQGIIGFGSGGVLGLGPGASRQRDFFLPESYGDFAFSVLGEEYGLVGTLFIMGLFLFLLLRGMRIVKYAPDQFGRYLAVGITSSIALFALVNAGVTLGILPTTGLPMPFLSYGGSSILFSSIAVGVLLNISSQTDLHPRSVKSQGELLAVDQQPAVGKVY